MGWVSMGLFGMTDEKTSEFEAHVRLKGALAKEVRERAERSSRSVVAEIRRALRAAYRLGATDV